MKFLQHTLKLAMIVFVLVFTSCSKDDSTTEDSTALEEPTTQELLISGKWFIQSTSGGGSQSECERQSYFQFFNGNTMLSQTFYEDIELNCLSHDVQNSTYQVTDEDVLSVSGFPGPPFTIDFISETQLVLRQTQGMSNYIINLSK